MPLERRVRTPRALLGAIVASAVLLTQAIQCSSGDESDLPDAIYEGRASDEAYERLLDKLPAAQVSAMSAIVITSPANGSQLPSAPPPTLAWNLPTATLDEPRTGPRRFRDTPSWLAFRSAEAHLPPLTGNVFYLEIRSSSREEDTIRVLTTETSWAIDDASWRKLRERKAPVTIKAYNAYLNRNIVEEGPFTPPNATEFTIAETP